MAFADKDLNAGLVGKTISGLVVSQPAVMEVAVASGSVILQQNGVTYTFVANSEVFTSDPTNPKQVFMAIIDNGVSTDLWVDDYIDDGLNVRGDIPAGYTLIQALAWFSIAAAETDLANATINRRVFV